MPPKRDRDFVIIARTDARGVNGFDDAVSRAKSYFWAGADAIFPEALESPEEFDAFAHAIPAPLLANNTEFGKSPNLDVETFAKLGYRMVLFPLTAFRSALKAAQDTLADHYPNPRPPAAVPLAGHVDACARTFMILLNYADYEARDRKYFG